MSTRLSTTLLSKAPHTPSAEGDHRKRRRNRTTQSCLNCHATKRMCDRKRPCSRCSQLGLTGNCVYEVDDPNKTGKQDEGSRLKSRIAELEGVVRELKKKPHPRWLAERDLSNDPPSSPSSGGPPTPLMPSSSCPSSPRLAPANGAVPTHSQLGACDSSFESLLSMYTGLTEHVYFGKCSCGCINEVACYHVVLDLSLRLRKAADILAQSPSHSTNSGCALNTRISALDTLLKDSLLNFPTTSSPQIHDMGASQDPFYAHFNQQYPCILSYGADDLSISNGDFMSWIPSDF